MHGIIFVELQRFVERVAGAPAWRAITGDAGLQQRVYTSVRDYPDDELNRLLKAASRATGKSREEQLEAFGTFIAPDLLSMFAVLIKPEWRTLDVIENTEAVIHTVVRTSHPGAKPPELKTVRLSPTVLELIYESPRRMCRLARGIIRGIAARFHEDVQIDEPECMLDGADACIIEVRAGAT